MTATPQDIEALKARLKATWNSGDYGAFSAYSGHGAIEFLVRLDVRRGERVLDVACGVGQLAISASRIGAVATGVDLAPNWLAQARARAAEERLHVRFDEGDVEDLPYADASFELVISVFGAMFAPRPERVASELVRVCHPGGRIAMANWTPNGLVGKTFTVTAAHIPPPPIPPPTLWGDEEIVGKRLSDGIAELRCTKRSVKYHYPFGVPEMVEFYRQTYGPLQRAFAMLDERRQDALRRDLEQLCGAHNQATDGTTDFESEYLEAHGSVIFRMVFTNLR